MKQIWPNQSPQLEKLPTSSDFVHSQLQGLQQDDMVRRRLAGMTMEPERV